MNRRSLFGKVTGAVALLVAGRATATAAEPDVPHCKFGGLAGANPHFNKKKELLASGTYRLQTGMTEPKVRLRILFAQCNNVISWHVFPAVLDHDSKTWSVIVPDRETHECWVGVELGFVRNGSDSVMEFLELRRARVVD